MEITSLAPGATVVDLAVRVVEVRDLPAPVNYLPRQLVVMRAVASGRAVVWFTKSMRNPETRPAPGAVFWLNGTVKRQGTYLGEPQLEIVRARLYPSTSEATS